MAGNIPNSYDMLSIYGVLPYDANQIITGEPSPYLQQNTPKLPNSNLKQDEFKPSNKKPINPKALGLAALGTYLAGVVLSKGSKNPIKGLKAIGKFAFNLIKLPLNVLKK